MPLILRKFQSFPTMQEDGSFIDVPFATISFVDPSGKQYAQLNVHADEVAGFSEGAALILQNVEAIDWQGMAQRIIDYAEDGEAVGPLMQPEKVIAMIKEAVTRPLEIVKAEPHGLLVPDDHGEMILNQQVKE